MVWIVWKPFYCASDLKQKKWKLFSSLQKCHDPSFPFNNCKVVKALLLATNDEFRNSFFINVHEILQSAFECIETDSSFKAAIKKSPLMKFALLASMRIEVGLDQWPSMNGIIFMIVCRCCRKNVFKDPDDDDKEFVSSFGTLENAMLSQPMACYFHRLKSVVMFKTKDGNASTFIRNRLLHSL